jgi:hypothetical protein
MFRFRIAWRHNARPILIVAAGWIAVHVHHPPSPEAMAAEVLLLRKQLAYYQDHQIRPRLLQFVDGMYIHWRNVRIRETRR